eukprot:symbB.v1.2.009455.t1/scaffold601.1/size182750/19
MADSTGPNPNAPPFIPGGQAFGVGVRGHHGFDMGTHLSEEHMVAMSQRAPPGHETKRQMELTRALHGSKAQGKQKCPEDNLEATQGSRKSSFARQFQEQSDAMGSAESLASAMSSCVQLPSMSYEEVRPPWALAQADKFEYEDCPFCRLRRSHCTWLKTEIKRLKSEAAAVQTTIPPSILPELMKELEVERWNCRCWGLVALNSQAGRLPPSGYTGGVDDIVASSCPRCEEWRQEVLDLQEEARFLDAQCKARIEFRSGQARQVEDLLIAKRRVEAKLLSAGQGVADDGKLSVITRVNLADEDAWITAAKQPL